MNEKCVRERCDCGCCVVEFKRTDWDDGEVKLADGYVSVYAQLYNERGKQTEGECK